MQERLHDEEAFENNGFIAALEWRYSLNGKPEFLKLGWQSAKSALGFNFDSVNRFSLSRSNPVWILWGGNTLSGTGRESLPSQVDGFMLPPRSLR